MSQHAGTCRLHFSAVSPAGKQTGGEMLLQKSGIHVHLFARLTLLELCKSAVANGTCVIVLPT